MIELSDSELNKWKESFAKDGITYKTDEEYMEAISNLIEYIELLVEIESNQKKRKAA